jgi:two-component system, chemotaxis family, sensor kinase CheA
MLKRLPIRLKLILLAGVPVIGALILAISSAREARRQAQSAAALGSIEDLAHLAAHMSGLVHELQFERHDLSLRTAEKTLDAMEVKARFAKTDSARQKLAEFLVTRKVSTLPPRLARDLAQAQSKLNAIDAERKAALAREQPIDVLWAYYEQTDRSLISATAALSQLTDDGELMRAISALVTVLQIKERASEEHALLSHVFALNEFPAGSFKTFVTLMTEEADYIRVLEVNATDRVNERFHQIQSGPEFARTAELRKLALEDQDDDFQVQPREWAEAQGKKIDGYRRLEIELNEDVKVAALAKVAAAEGAVRLSYGLGGGIIVLSALLAGLIARGISRSVAALSRAADEVRQDKDFSVRAVKMSDDELGALTDAFNEMLAGIQARDTELTHHRENLERLVEQRTAALQRRNEAMRLVLDNVEQGLATIEPDGKLSSERSRAFDDWFGGNKELPFFGDQIAGNNETVRATLRMAWEQVVDGFLPIDVSIDQMPRQIEVAGRQYHLEYKAILEKDGLHGALLVISDVTQEMERLQRDAEQREMLSVFERVMRDRSGFIEFFKECEALVKRVVGREISDPQQVMRAVHTVKGNCGMFGIGSVAQVAHHLESSLLESGQLPAQGELDELQHAWTRFSERVMRLAGSEEEPLVEMAYEELEELEQAAASRAPHLQIAELLHRLKYERGIVRLRRVAELAKSLADRLGKGGLEVQVEAGKEVRFQAERWAPFWASFVHVVRNALDHGIELPDARIAAGKPAHGKLQLGAHVDGELFSIELGDDGRGINWARVREKAIERGLSHSTDQDLVNALFSDGLSTAEEVSDVSGRGVGMSAVRDAARQLGGTVSVVSKPGTGTVIRFRFPAAETMRSGALSRYPGARPSLAPPPPAAPRTSRISAA